jgi:HEAT repeat protein
MGRRDPAALPAVLKLLDHRRDTVRSAAGRVLGAYRDHELVQPLTRVAEGDRAWVVRQEAIRALGLLPAESATPTLVRSLTSDKAYQVRHAAVLALCSSAGCPVARALQAAMKDRAVEVRGAARYCLARLGAAQPPSDPVALEDWVAGWCTDTPGITQ